MPRRRRRQRGRGWRRAAGSTVRSSALTATVDRCVSSSARWTCSAMFARWKYARNARPSRVPVGRSSAANASVRRPRAIRVDDSGLRFRSDVLDEIEEIGARLARERLAEEPSEQADVVAKRPVDAILAHLADLWWADSIKDGRAGSAGSAARRDRAFRRPGRGSRHDPSCPSCPSPRSASSSSASRRTA